MTFIELSFNIYSMKIKYITLVCLMALAISSCTHFKPSSSVINIVTDKPAKINVWDYKSEKNKELGATPFEAKFVDLQKETEQDEWIYLVVSAPGYATENIIVPANQKANLGIKLKLQPIEWWNDSSKSLPSVVINQIGQQIQRTYINIRQGKLDEALSAVEKIIAEYPQAPFLLDLKGSILVLQGKSNDAISSYERSLQISSDNPDTVKTLNELKKNRVNQ